MNTRIISIAQLGLFLVQSVTAADFHVSPNGNDANPGTQEQPFATLERARDVIRGERQAGRLDGPMVVNLQGGVYQMMRTFPLTAEDSGTAQAPVIWRAAPGETVRLLGGVPVANWAPVTDAATLDRLASNARGKVLQANLKDLGVTDFGEVGSNVGKRADLFCQGRYMTLARYPDVGWLRIASVPQDGELKFPGDFRNSQPTRIGGKIAGKHYGRFCYSGDRPSRWRMPEDLWVHGYWVWDYQDQYHAVEKLDIEKHEVWPKPPYHFYGYHENARYCFLNVLEELDRPGEWYLDRRTGTIYLWPPEAGAEKDAVFSLLAAPLVRLENVSHVQVRGLTFEAGRAGGIAVSGGERVTIAGCTFRNLANPAIAVAGGTNHLVRSCDLYELGGGGIRLEGGDRKTLTPGGHAVENCHIHHIGRVKAPCKPAVHLSGVGLRVAHCLIHDCPHGGLGYTGNDHTIEYCDFTRIGYDAGDTGTIYTAMDWTYRGHVIRHNYFHGIHSPPQVHVGSMTVYLDLPCGGVHLYGNVFFDNQRAFFTNSGRDCLIENNLFVQCDPAVQFNCRQDMKQFEKGGSWRMVERLTDGIAYDQPPYSTRYPELLRLFKDGDIRIPTGNIVRCNISTGGTFLVMSPQVDFEDVKIEQNLIGDRTLFAGSPTGNGKSEHYFQADPVLTPLWEKAGNLLREGDPGFVDAARQDFRLKPDSPAWNIGFKPIPFDQIGLHKDRYRTALPLPPPIITPSSRSFVDELVVELLPSPRSPDVIIRYTLDGGEPTSESPRYRTPVVLNQTTTLRAAVFLPDGSATSRVVEETFTGTRLADGIYLSGLPAVNVLAHAGLKQDANYSGETIVLNGRSYERGIMLCPEATGPDYTGGKGHVTYVLDGGLKRASRFRAVVGIEDEVKSNGSASVTFAVDVRRNGAWQCVFESPVLRWGQTREVDIDISGAALLRLRTTDGGDYIFADHAVWADARLR